MSGTSYKSLYVHTCGWYDSAARLHPNGLILRATRIVKTAGLDGGEIRMRRIRPFGSLLEDCRFVMALPRSSDQQ